jgi:hypothetical protein
VGKPGIAVHARALAGRARRVRRQLDGSDVLKFEKGEPGFSDYTRAHPTTELHESGGYIHPSVTRVQTLGCYAYQVDGIGFSYSIVFRAVAA